MLKHVPAAAPALDEVKEAVREQLLMERALRWPRRSSAAGAEGGRAQLRRHGHRLAHEPAGLPREALNKILLALGQSGQTFGVDLGTGGYLLVRLNAVKPPSEQKFWPSRRSNSTRRRWPMPKGLLIWKR
ncbi:MAG: hypothetical protein U1E77_14330 [Inhella sp.]